MDDALKNRIQGILDAHPIVLFMKGTKTFPQCGFSHRAVEVLKRCGATQFHEVNVLEDAAIREGIKEFGNWPTIPQLYLKGKLIGGSDILMEMFENGELQPLVDEAKAG
jgi:monothiol glutaredoxin